MRFQVEKNPLAQMKRRESCSVMSDSVTPQTTVLGILQARILEWVAVPFSRGLIKQGGPNTELALMLKQLTEAKQNLSL